MKLGFGRQQAGRAEDQQQVHQIVGAAGHHGDAMWIALRNSYRTTPNEGWIASERVVFGLRAYSILPTDLRPNVFSDLRLVLASSRLAIPLVIGHAVEASLRTAA